MTTAVFRGDGGSRSTGARAASGLGDLWATGLLGQPAVCQATAVTWRGRRGVRALCWLRGGRVGGALEQFLERRHVSGLDLLRQPRVAEQFGIAREHSQQRLAVV